LPDLATWGQEFARIVNGMYELRGVEVTLRGDVALRQGQLLLARATGHLIGLLPLTQAEKIQWDHTRRSPRPLEDDEAEAFDELLIASRDTAEDSTMTVTGPLRQTGAGYVLHVRRFARADP
jgi:galactose oxidase